MVGSKVVNKPEDEIIRLVRAGHSDVFANVVETYQKPVYNLCYRMLGDPYDAEDAAQESFIRALKNIKRYDPRRPFSTWLLSIAAHYCIDQLRKRRNKIVSIEGNPDISLQELSPGPELATIMSEEQDRIRKILDTLSPTDRAAVILRYWNELSYEEIAQTLSLTVSAVKSRLHRSRQTLAESWLEQTSQNILIGRTRHESPIF
jgi:RNA polymerase sigma-70 factor, ECF subfamily